jgi:hypothetical protein
MSTFVSNPNATRTSLPKGTIWAIVALAALLLVNVPLFLHMPIWPDATFYDLCARNILQGGVHYRDIFDNNLPGIVWIHAAIRSVLGWRPEMLRLVDLLFMAGAISLLVSWVPKSTATRLWTAAVLFGCYFATSEYCHCQRDVWMMAPALAALGLRAAQVERLRMTQPGYLKTMFFAFCEGICWIAALWIKPHVAVPALACWTVAARYILRSGPDRWRLLSTDALGLLGGIGLGAVLGCAYLWQTNAWDSFLDVFLNWNREYVPSGGYLDRGKLAITTIFPWGLIHIPAVLLALWAMRSPTQAPAGRALLAACYLGWLLQAVWLQRAFPYHLVPPLLLALTLLASHRCSAFPWRVMVVGFLGLAVALHPMVWPERLVAWPSCWMKPGKPALQDRLALIGGGKPHFLVSHADLENVAHYLHEQHLQDGTLTCYDWRTIDLYRRLNQRPASRFVLLSAILYFYPSHEQEVIRSVRGLQPQFVVTDLTTVGLTTAQAGAFDPNDPLALPPRFPQKLRTVYPWCEPIVFRSGQYAVHRPVPAASAQRKPGDAENAVSPAE